MKHRWRLASDQRGASAAEYAVLLGLIGSAIAIATTELGASIGCSIERTAAIIAEKKPPKNNQYGNSDPKGNAFGQRKPC